jgi:multidrug efflux pump subunit AcrA (membrane-fusion protein)
MAETMTFDPTQESPVRLRVLVSPGTGRLRFLPPRHFEDGVELVEQGQPVFRLVRGKDEVIVRAPVSGKVSAILAIEGEPVAAGHAVLAIEPAADGR